MEYIYVGQINGTHGLKGELKLKSNFKYKDKILKENFNFYIGKEKTAPYYRIRVGAKDADTSLTVTMILALKLMECGKTNVDYEIVWNEVHGRADYPGEMVEWVRSIYAI